MTVKEAEQLKENVFQTLSTAINITQAIDFSKLNEKDREKRVSEVLGEIAISMLDTAVAMSPNKVDDVVLALVKNCFGGE